MRRDRAATDVGRRWAGPVFVATALLSAWVLFGPTNAGDGPFPGADKVVHVVLFALLAASARWCFGASRTVLVLLVAYAAGSEVVQGVLLEARSGDPLDVVADLLGVALGWTAARSLRAG